MLSKAFDHHLPVVSAERWFGRELSWLAFNTRVLELAEDPRTPLLERAKFLAIFSSNLDEFFQIRVAGLRDQVVAGSSGAVHNLALVLGQVRRLVERVAIAYDQVVACLGAEGLKVVGLEQLSPGDMANLSGRFEREMLPVLTPLTVDASHPFPYISSLSLNLAVSVRDPETGQHRFARVKVPSNLARLVDVGGGRGVLLEEVLAAHLDALFPGMRLEEHHTFRVTRDADLDIQEDEADDLLNSLEEELRQRRFGAAVRLEVSPAMPQMFRDLLCEELDLDSEAVIEVTHPLDLTALWELWRSDRPDLKDVPWPAAVPVTFAAADGSPQAVFDAIRAADQLVHHPYESFAATVQRFVEAAAADDAVLAIKTTLYRTSNDSPIIDALVRAANAGKQVLVLVELNARFDEQNNIVWAKTLERAGAHVVYGQLGLKTHAKAALVVRADLDRLRRYCHIGTGNYNPATARLYEDVGLFTANQVIGEQLGRLFNSLSGFSRPLDVSPLLVAPHSLRSGLLARINAEAERGAEGRVTAKMNSLVDPAIIDALYAASVAGAEVDLIIRGICSLRPGVPGLSERIRVRSILGRYLEHSRIFCFGELAAPRAIYIGSADMMQRNLDGRVELVTPIEAPNCVARLTTILSACLADDSYAWHLDADGTWTRPQAGTLSAQRLLYEHALHAAGN